MKKNIFLFPVLFILISGCISPRGNRLEREEITLRPLWVNTGKNIKFPEAFYLTGVGLSSFSLQKADDLARQELAKQVQVQVSGVDEVVLSEKKEMKEGVLTSTTYSDVQSGIRINVDQKLAGVRIAERWLDEERGEYYSLAVLDREEATARLTKKISRAYRKSLSLFDQGKDYRSEKKYIQALTTFLNVELLLLETEPDILARSVISGELKDEPEESPYLMVREAIDEIVSNLKIQDLSPEKRGEETLPSPVVGVFYENGGKTVPVQGAPLVLRFDNRREVKKYTDLNGLIDIKVLAAETSRNEPGELELTFDIKEILKGLYSGHTQLKGLAAKRLLVSYPTRASHPALPLLTSERAFKTLAFTLLSNLKNPENLSITCAVTDFVEITSQNRLKFSQLVENELKTALTLSKKIPVKVVDKAVRTNLPIPEKGLALKVPYVISGSYQLKKNGVKINAKLLDVNTNIILSAAEVMMDRDEAKEMDFIVSGVSESDKTYLDTINSLLSGRPQKNDFNLKMWTDKKVYTIGESVTFYFTTDRDCYLVLLDLGTSGTISYLFPNEFHPNSFVKKGEVYSIPGKAYGFTIKTEGPPGVERVKALASTAPLSINRFNLKKGFFTFPPGNGKRSRDLRLEVDRLYKMNWSESYYEFYIQPPKGVRYRGLTKEVVAKPEKPIDIIGTQGAVEEKVR